jgi:hypothetical protein
MNDQNDHNSNQSRPQSLGDMSFKAAVGAFVFSAITAFAGPVVGIVAAAASGGDGGGST